MDLIIKHNEKPMTTSLCVAAIFEKQHKNILRDIKTIQNTLNSLGNSQLIFELSTYISRKKEYPMYLMDRDAFTMLVFGFNGQKALKFKTDFIKAFNEMELQLMKSKIKPPSLPELLRAAANEIENHGKQNYPKKVMTIVQLPRHIKPPSVRSTLGSIGLRTQKTTDFLVKEGYLELVNETYAGKRMLKVPTKKGEKFFVSQLNKGLYILPEGIKMIEEKRDTGKLPADCLKIKTLA